MTKGLNYSEIYHWYIGLTAAVLCFSQKLSVLMIIGLFLMVVSGILLKKLQFRLAVPSMLLMSLYVAYLIGMIFTENMALARLYAENKISFFLLPLLFSFVPRFKVKVSGLAMGLCIGITVAFFIGVWNVFFSESVQGIQFTSVHISPLHHPTYMAMFSTISLFGAWWNYYKKEPYFKLKWIVPYSLMALILIILCLALSGIIYMFILFSVLTLVFVWHKFSRIVFYLLCLGVPLIFFLIFNYTPGLKEDVAYTTNSLSMFIEDPDNFVKSKTQYKTGNETRMIMWTVTLQEILDHPLGVGTGNVDQHLSERLSSKGQIVLAQKDDKGGIAFNPHNQFLQTTLEIGLIGGGLLIAWILSILMIAIRNRDLWLTVIVTCFAFNSLFESVLQRQSGIIFFTFVLSFYILSFPIGKRVDNNLSEG